MPMRSVFGGRYFLILLLLTQVGCAEQATLFQRGPSGAQSVQAERSQATPRGGGTIRQGTSPWLTAPDGTSWGKVSDAAKVNLTNGSNTDANGNAKITDAASTVDPYTNRIGKRITSATTTVLLPASASTVIRVFWLSACVDWTGVQTTFTFEDNSGSPIDLFSGTTTTLPYQVNPGECKVFRPAAVGTFVGNPLTAGQNFQVVTTGTGPANVVADVRQE